MSVEEDQPPHMYRYWRDKKGTARHVLEIYYPETLKANHDLRRALLEIDRSEKFVAEHFAKAAEVDGTDTW